MEEWKSRYSDLEERHNETEKLLHSEQSQATVESDVPGEEVSELQATIDQLREEVAKQDAEARGAVAQWMSSYDELKAQYDSLQQSHAHGSGSAEQNEIVELRKKLNEETAAADNAIAQWQASYNGLKEQYDVLQNQWAGVSSSEGEASGLASENEALKKQLEEQATEAEQVVAQWQASFNDLQARYDALEQHSTSSDEKDANISVLQNEIDTLKQRLKDESAEADNAISQWQTSYSELQSQYEALLNSGGEGSGDTAALQAEVESLKAQLKEEADEADRAVEQWQASYEELKKQYDETISDLAERGDDKALRDEIEALKKQIEEESAEAGSAIEQWQAAYNDIKEQFDALKNLNETAASGGWDTNVEELRTEVENLKQQMEEERSDAGKAIAQWQESYKTLNEQFESLSSQAQTQPSSETVDGNAEEIESLRQQLEQEKAEADAVVAQWEMSYNDLQEQYQELVGQSSAEKEEADVAVAQWEASYKDLQAHYKALTAQSSAEGAAEAVGFREEIESLKKQLEEKSAEAESAISEWQASYDALKSQFDGQQGQDRGIEPSDGGSEVTQLKQEVGELKQQLEDSDVDAANAIAQWQDAYNNLQQEFETFKSNAGSPMNDDADIAQLQSELEGLKKQLAEEAAEADNVVSQWETSYNDLREQFESLQAASDVSATDGLDSEVEQLKTQTDAC